LSKRSVGHFWLEIVVLNVFRRHTSPHHFAPPWHQPVTRLDDDLKHPPQGSFRWAVLQKTFLPVVRSQNDGGGWPKLDE
jgi:hypothetical protein